MSSRFITESEVTEARQKRQEEWEKVRKADDPLEAPEAVYDSRSLYDRLQEQKQKKDLEYEEAHKLKNMIKGLDDDEIEFLDLVDRTKLAADRKKDLEEEKELNDFRNRVANLQEKSLDHKLQANINNTKPKMSSGSRLSQTKLLKGMIVVKNDSSKRKVSDESESNENSMENKKLKLDENGKEVREVSSSIAEDLVMNSVTEQNSKNDGNFNSNTFNVSKDPGLTCVAILPGLGYYEESSSDECSSNSDEDSPIENAIARDLLGRRIVKKAKQTRVRRSTKINAALRRLLIRHFRA